MQTTIRYLRNPMETGIFHGNAIIDFCEFSNFVNKTIETLKEERKRSRGYLRSYNKELTSNLSEKFELFSQWNRAYVRRSDDNFLKLVKEILVICARTDSAPPEFKKVFTKNSQLSSGRLVQRITDVDIFSSHVLPELNDAISIERVRISNDKWLFDLVALRKDTLIDFKTRMESIPPFKGKVNWKAEKQHYSMRYCLRPYPWIVQLWLDKEESLSLPNDLKSFISGAAKYFFTQEWRTSIVLSAITVESILADLYEENNREPAPDTPLGDLFRKVGTKFNFPEDIVRSIEATNNARIAAVHRSRFPVSDREAINALFGATNLIIWHYQS